MICEEYGIDPDKYNTLFAHEVQDFLTDLLGGDEWLEKALETNDAWDINFYVEEIE